MSICLLGQNTAIQLDGNSENLVINHKPIFDVKDTGHTIEAWIFANTWTSEIWRGSLVTNDDQGPDRGYAFRCGNNGSLSFVMSVDNTWNDIETTSLMNTKQWHHVAVTIGNGTMVLYVDGLAINSGSYNGNIITNPTNSINIGSSAGFGGRYFDGIIDEVRIWNVARTPAEIADNTTTSFTGTEAGLVAYFPMNEGSGTSATNLIDAACSAAGVGINDDNWVDGYALPDFDLSVKEISGIDRLNMKTRPVKVSVAVQNVGLQAINNYNLTLFVDGNEAANEQVDMELAAGAVATYIFKTPIDLSEISTATLQVELSHPDDANGLNNSSSTELINKDGNLVNLFERSVHNFGSAGQSQNAKISLPGDLSEYEQILLHIKVDCPAGGCDPWDQTAKVIINSDLGALEIARYITPYEIACGPWTVDVTDFSSVLAGENNYNSFVQVFGPSGWAVTLDLEFVGSSDLLPYSRVTPLWSNDYVVYGDPNISYDIEEAPVSIANNTGSHHVRMHVTGHGQGNTSNAAEFFDVRHELLLGGNKVAEHHLWKDDCATNICTEQNGNYFFSRAGWCPGQEVIPAIFETTSFLAPGRTASFDYELQEYTNLLNTGYNNTGHTEPHYRLHGFFVERSGTRYETYTNLEAESIVMEGDFERLSITVVNNGSEPVNGFTVHYYYDGELLVSENVDQVLEPGESISYDFNDVMILQDGGLEYIYGEVTLDTDQNPGDNLTKFFVGLDSEVQDLSLLNNISVYPNPSNGTIQLEVTENMLGGQLELLSIEGKHILVQEITQLQTDIDNLVAGTLILKVRNAEGNFASKKIVVLD